MTTTATKVKIGTQYITTPNMVGEIVRETPKMIIVKVTGKTFKSKSSATLTHKFTKGEREWHLDRFKPYERRFWKDTGYEVGGTAHLIDYPKN